MAEGPKDLVPEEVQEDHPLEDISGEAIEGEGILVEGPKDSIPKEV